jgi:hypothetical protein
MQWSSLVRRSGALLLLRGEAKHRSSTMDAVVLFSEEERRI